MKTNEDNGISLDYFYRNKVKVYQNIKGYRFSVDSPILADFIPESEENAIEVGSGSGIISLLVLHKKKIPFITGIEVQKKLFELSKKSIVENNMAEKFNVINADFNEIYDKFSGIKTIFSNPPYLQTNIGHLSTDPEIRKAKFEIVLKLSELIRKSYKILGEKGSLFLILPFTRYEELTAISKSTGFHMAKLRRVLSFKDGKPERFLIQLTNYESSFSEISPLVIYKTPGTYSEEMEKIFSGR
ncbi:MAG: methyltransferase [Acidobacteriota bacterium]